MRPAVLASITIMHTHARLILSLLILFAPTVVFGQRHIATICSSTSGNFSSQDVIYLRYLREVINITISASPSDVSASYVSTGIVYSLSVCRPDVGVSTCRDCLIEVTSRIRHDCPNNKEAIIWADYCQFRYSNKNMLGTVDLEDRAYKSNDLVARDPTVFNEKVVHVLKLLAQPSHHQPGEIFFATKEKKIYGESSKVTLYALVMCAWDLSQSECKRCLQTILSQFLNCCDGKLGGMVMGGSCNFRYALSPFYNSTTSQ